MKKTIEIVSVRDNDDGSVSIAVDMDIESLKVFASIGLLEVFKSKAMEVINGHTNPEGSGNAETGDSGHSDIWG